MAWTAEQILAIDTDKDNILVSAAAGSGKTAVLVERIIKKVLSGIDVDRIVVVTFTRTAAAEMKERLRSALEKELDKNPDDEHIKRQMTLINNADISTIDSFCFKLVKSHFQEIDLDPDIRVMDGEEKALILSDCMDQLLEENFENADQDFKDFVANYAKGKDDTKLAEMISGIYNFSLSYPWPEEWLESCEELYEISSEEEFRKTGLFKYTLASVQEQLLEIEKEDLEILEQARLNQLPSVYISIFENDLEKCDKLKQALTKLDFEDLDLSFDAYNRSTKGLSDDQKEARVSLKERRDQNKERFLELVKLAKNLDIKGALEDIAALRSYVHVIIRLVRDYASLVSQTKKDKNIVDFSDIEAYALRILVNRADGISKKTEVARRLSEKYEEIMIDEYQDSNRLQEAILSAISKGKVNDAAGSAGEAEPLLPLESEKKIAGNMFMVGDVKQSIYRFRMACPELFLTKYKDFNNINPSALAVADKKGLAEGLSIDLAKNFRSRQGLIESVNDVFKGLMNESYTGLKYDDRAKLYLGADYYLDKKPQAVIEDEDGKLRQVHTYAEDGQTDVYMLPKNRLVGENSFRNEAVTIGLAIKEAMNPKDKGIRMVYDKAENDGQGGYRPIKFSDIAILASSTKDIDTCLIETLMDMGIPAYSETKGGFYDAREVKLILNYLTIIVNPLNDIAFAACLMSYFGRMDSDELALIKSFKLDDNYEKDFLYDQLRKLIKLDSYDELQLSEEFERKLEVALDKASLFIEKLDSYRLASQVESIYDLVWSMVYSTGYYDYVLSMPAGERRQINIDMLLSAARDFEKTSYRGAFNFQRYIERINDSNVEKGEASTLGENDNVVRIMTIHKSKGLEFPLVILALAGKGIESKEGKNGYLVDSEFGIGLNRHEAKRRIKKTTFSFDAVKAKIKQETIAEKMRVLYVAMTRAREKLIITGVIESPQARSSVDPQKAYTDALDSYMQKAEGLSHKACINYGDCVKLSSFNDMVLPAAFNSSNFKLIPVAYEALDKFEDRDAFEQLVADIYYEYKEKALHIGLDTAYEGENIKSQDSGEGPGLRDRYCYELPQYQYERQDYKTKVTVTELKKMINDTDFDEGKFLMDGLRQLEDEAESSELSQDDLPDFMIDEEKQEDSLKKKASGAQRGTAYHRLMECLDYSGLKAGLSEAQYLDYVNKEFERITERSLMLEDETCLIKKVDIVTFLMSDIGQRTIEIACGQNSYIKREQPFIFRDDLAQVRLNQLIQGVIDLYLVDENGQIEIVDYKTDRVSKDDGEEKLKALYKVQLDIYAKAISQLTGAKVNRKTIYSFALGRAIEL